MTELRRLLGLADFRRLWIAQVISDFGDSLTIFTLLLLVQRLTGDEAAVASILIASALPTLVVGLLAGVWVDRWNLRTVMIGSDLVRALLVLGLITVDGSRLWMLYVLVFLQASVSTFFRPARQSLLPRIVTGEMLLSANSLNEVTRVAAYTGGTAAAGLMVGLADAFVPVFLIDASTFLVSAALVARVVTSGTPSPRSGREGMTVWADLGEGIGVLLRSRWLLGVLMGAGPAMFGLGAINGLIVPFVIGEIGLPETWFGLLEGSQALGVIIAGGLTALLAKRFVSAHLLGYGLVAVGVVVAGFALADGVITLVILMLLVGLAVAPVQASAVTILQRETPPEMIGRAASALSAGSTGSQIGSLALAGTLATLVGVRLVFVLSGVVAALAGLVALALFRSARNLTPADAPA